LGAHYGYRQIRNGFKHKEFEVAGLVTGVLGDKRGKLVTSQKSFGPFASDAVQFPIDQIVSAPAPQLRECLNHHKTIEHHCAEEGFWGWRDIMNQPVEKLLESNRGAAVLLVDEDLDYLEAVRRTIQGSGHRVKACNSYTDGIRQLESGDFDIVFVGQGSRHFEGRCMLEYATAFDRHLPIVVVARYLEMACYLEAMQLGAVDYISPGLSESEIAHVVQTHSLHRRSRSGSVEQELSTPAAVSTGCVV
jgi:FixJ family two-component response regulator